MSELETNYRNFWLAIQRKTCLFFSFFYSGLFSIPPPAWAQKKKVGCRFCIRLPSVVPTVAAPNERGVLR